MKYKELYDKYGRNIVAEPCYRRNELVGYEGYFEDEDNHMYHVTWEIDEDYADTLRKVNEAYRRYWDGETVYAEFYLDLVKIEDEANACDWDNPVEITSF